MSSQFPTSIVTTTNIPTASPSATLAASNHTAIHNNLRDEVIAVETSIGITGSADNTSLTYKTANITGGDRAIGASQTVTVTNKTLGTGTKVTLGSDATGDMYYRDASGNLTRVGIGSTGQVQTVVAGVPVWQSPSAINANYITDTGAVNAIVATLSPALGSYSAGTLVQVKVAVTNTGSTTINVNGLGVKTIKKTDGATNLVAGDIVAGQVIALEYDGTNFQLMSPTVNTANIKFGGTGADGALTISSGTTNIDLANASVVEKNYTSISITGTGKLTFTNPNANGTIIKLRSQGAVTLTSSQAPMIDASGLGGPVGAGAASGGGANSGSTTTFGNSNVPVAYSLGTAAGPNSGSVQGGVSTLYPVAQNTLPYSMVLACGGGGGGGADGGSGGTNGGRGGGALIIECRGALNFTTASGISVAGAAGTNATAGLGAGGGGGGGTFVCLYNTLTASSGTVTITGGAGGTGAGGGAGNAGAGGYGLGSAGSAGTGKGLAGGAGGTGLSLITTNNYFA